MNYFKKIEELLKKYEIQEIESAFVQFFVELNKIKVVKNDLIKTILLANNIKLKKIKSEIQNDFKKISLYGLINIFELLMSKKDQKLNGAFFTPELITKYITSNTIRFKDQTICDPSCGCGAFLIESVYFINKKYNRYY